LTVGFIIIIIIIIIIIESHSNTLMFIFVVVWCRVEFLTLWPVVLSDQIDEASNVKTGYDEMLLCCGCYAVLGECGAVIG
jgi:hypothetical protein